MPCADARHDHPWPEGGSYELRILSCETKCGWCNYQTKAANNLRVHARRHTRNAREPTLRLVRVQSEKAGRSKLTRCVAPNVMCFNSDETNPDEIYREIDDLRAENKDLKASLEQVRLENKTLIARIRRDEPETSANSHRDESPRLSLRRPSTDIEPTPNDFFDFAETQPDGGEIVSVAYRRRKEDGRARADSNENEGNERASVPPPSSHSSPFLDPESLLNLSDSYSDEQASTKQARHALSTTRPNTPETPSSLSSTPQFDWPAGFDLRTPHPSELHDTIQRALAHAQSTRSLSPGQPESRYRSPFRESSPWHLDSSSERGLADTQTIAPRDAVI